MSTPYVRVLTPPSVEPVTLAEARLWCRIADDDATQDAMLQLLIIAARERAEEITGRAFCQRTLEASFDEFPEGDEAIELPFPPLVSVSSITYSDDSGSDQVLGGSPDAFIVDTASYPGRIAPLFASSWPTASSRIGAVRVAYACGYQNTSSIPKKVRIWMQALVSTLFENREQMIVGNIVNEIPRNFLDGLLDDLRVKTMFK